MKSRNVFTVLLAVWLFLLNMLPALAATEMEKQQKELDKAQHNVQVAEENKDKAKLKVAAAKESLGEIVAKLSRLQQDIDKLQKKADALQKDIDENTAVLRKRKWKGGCGFTAAVSVIFMRTARSIIWKCCWAPKILVILLPVCTCCRRSSAAIWI